MQLVHQFLHQKGNVLIRIKSDSRRCPILDRIADFISIAVWGILAAELNKTLVACILIFTLLNRLGSDHDQIEFYRIPV